jgi:hypothetical protein
MHELVKKFDSFVLPLCFSMEVLRLRRGPPKGSKYCDFLEVLKFLDVFRKRARNIYQIYHSSLRFDSKKIYRYLRYCLNANLIEIDHIEEDKFLPAKYYRLTSKGKALLNLFSSPHKKLIGN